MALETGTYISDLVATNPTSGDPVSQADDHMRLIKATLQNTFSNIDGEVSATEEQINRLTGSNSLVVDRAYAEYMTNADIASAIPFDDTIPQVTEGTQILSVSLTPKSTSNRVRVLFYGQAFSTAATANVIAALFVNGGSNAVRTTLASTGGAGFSTQVVLMYEFVPASTSAQTFTVRIGTQNAVNIRMNGSSSRLFGGSMAATIVVEEIAV